MADDISNGKPYEYPAASRQEHRKHVHACVYDEGGVLPAGATLCYNGESEPERVERLGDD